MASRALCFFVEHFHSRRVTKDLTKDIGESLSRYLIFSLQRKTHLAIVQLILRIALCIWLGPDNTDKK